MTISSKGIDLIKKWEQFRAEPYLCSAGKVTIGYGHTTTASMSQPSITERQAIDLLVSDLTIFEAQLKPLLKGIELNQNQYDAVVSFCFNLGVYTFKKSTAYKVMKKDPNSKHISDSWIQYRNAGGNYLRGLLKRRLDELTLYYK